ncbi:hypothetical protein HOE22_06495 [Candidatus Woesearchaeota archaeon]|nr:hypothetical protein [Candidatus Woesearchaeota archaeon]MBT4731775.1 hypothetical protein [Candidatus Woesearchaeota archaeon]MBT7557926.1 hypothetical protein [Candidatus Woesearchaeota archaeon]
MSNKRYLSILDEIKKHGGEEGNTENPNENILLVDGLNLFIRCFSVIPTTNTNGVHVGGISGFLKSLGYAIKLLSPTRTIIVFDGKGGSTRRRKLFPDYKAQRKTKIRLNRSDSFENLDDERQSMMMQLSRTAEYLETLPVTIISVDNIEADDAMAYIAKQLLPESNHVIMSTDKDFLQLVNDKISVWSPTKKKLYKPDNLKEEYEISANNFLTYRLLEGDKSDNIPGVMGVGLKTAIKRFPQLLDENVDVSIGDLLKTASDNKGIKIYDNVTNSEDKLRLNYKLMQLDEVDISGQVKLKINNIVNGKITETAKMNFQKMYIQDQMQHTIPNLESWFTQCWSKLNRFAKLSNG